MADQKLTHIVGTFLIQAEGAFLNGAGQDKSAEDQNTVIPKTFQDGRNRVPYVSSQAWRRWLRETFKQEYPDQPATELKALPGFENARGNTNKIGTDMNPIIFAEDDIFGYMRAEKGQGRTKSEDEDEEDGSAETEAEEATTKGKQKGSKTRSVMRPSPFSSSILKSIRTSGWQGEDEGFVHLKEGSPLPYKTRFYNTQLQGVFGLSYDRLGTFRNEGDRIELDELLASQYLKEGVIERDADREIYRVKNNQRQERATMILRSLAVLRGGAKQAQFGTDVSPKAIILAGLNCGNLIFNDLFEEKDLQPVLKLATLKQIIGDYQSRLVTPVFIGLREGYLHSDSETEVKAWAKDNAQVSLLSPVKAVEELTNILKDFA